MLWLVLPRLIPALILAGMLQVILTPGGPMGSVPLPVVLANSAMALGPRVAHLASWSLFGIQRVIVCEAPLMGWRFVAICVLPSLAYAIIAGWPVTLYYHE